MTDSEQPSRPLQFSLRTFLAVSVVVAVAISLFVKLASANPFGIGLVVGWLFVPVPCIIVAEIVAGMIGAKGNKE